MIPRGFFKSIQNQRKRNTNSAVDVDSNAFEGAAYCLGLLRGVTTVGQLTPGLKCLPNLPIAQHIKTIIEYIKSNEDSLKDDDVAVALEALFSKHKCN